jgi:hypothetical protein
MIDLEVQEDMIIYSKDLVNKKIMVKGVFMMEIKENNLLVCYRKIW